jgi:ribose transport system permease protein
MSATASLARWFRQNRGFATALLLFSLIYLVYNILHPRGFSTAVFVQNANESVALAFVAMAQTLPVLLGGLDLSVGAVMTLTSCIASELVSGSPAQILFGMVVTLLSGTAFGLMNGLVGVYGRIQPIIATLATGAIAIGLALWVRPKPGGDVDGDLNWAITNSVWDFFDTYGFDADAAWLAPVADIPVPIIILLGVAFCVWLPFRRSVTGRTVYAIGSAEGAAFRAVEPRKIVVVHAAVENAHERHQRDRHQDRIDDGGAHARPETDVLRQWLVHDALPLKPGNAGGFIMSPPPQRHGRTLE